jgi:hypothetical protein
MEGLVEIYGSAGAFVVKRLGDNFYGTSESINQKAPVLFECTRFKGSPGKKDGEPVIVDFAEFKSLFEATTLGVLQKVRNRAESGRRKTCCVLLSTATLSALILKPCNLRMRPGEMYFTLDKLRKM